MLRVKLLVSLLKWSGIYYTLGLCLFPFVSSDEEPHNIFSADLPPLMAYSNIFGQEQLSTGGRLSFMVTFSSKHIFPKATARHLPTP